MISKDKLNQLLFPHESVRNIQDQLILDVDKAITEKKDIIVHAPTGLGKTASTLSAALAHAIKNDLKVFFLTSKHTQHKIAVDTLKEMKRRHGVNITVLDIIGKKWMCLHDTKEMGSSEFGEFCKALREGGTCEFYTNMKEKGKKSILAKKAIDEAVNISPAGVDELVSLSRSNKVCPYEIAIEMAKKARVIISDYYYIFHPTIQSAFFNKANIDLSRCIIIIDEGHNLPDRLNNLMTSRISNIAVKNAVLECKKNDKGHLIDRLSRLQDALFDLKSPDDTECHVKKKEFIDKVNQFTPYETFITELNLAGEEIIKENKKSSLISISSFLEDWLGPEEGFTRVISERRGKSMPIISLNYSSLDPSAISKDKIDEAYSTILMSGTLTPTHMYKDLLGFRNVYEKEYSSPFPNKNRLNLIIPKTTTKFSMRSEEMYKEIAEISSDIAGQIPGNMIIFFPSYNIRDNVYSYLQSMIPKEILLESRDIGNTEKARLLERFKSSKDKGGILLAVSGANFAEGIDLPGDLLKCVVVVGLPLARPDLKTKDMIDYYDGKFGKGWDYGYLYPAFNKTLQAAGRCIRSEKDRGAVIFLDKRYLWSKYFSCFPKSWIFKIKEDYKGELVDFFF